MIKGTAQLLFVVFFAAVAAVFSVAPAGAEVTYPVEELGGCGSEAECKAYCDVDENFKPCLAFAEENNLLSAEELKEAKLFAELGEGPGGCKTPSACENYCDDVSGGTSRMIECIDFADKNNLIPAEELEEARKVKVALEKGAKLPGNCRNKQECETYCTDSDSTHMEECITFAEAAGFIPPEELEEAKKVMQAIKGGAKMPACKGKAACDTYCNQPDHFEECLTFAEAAGLLPPEEQEGARKALQAIKKGVRPPACRGKEACDAFCQQPENLESCMAFAVAAGFMTEEEAAMVRKTGGKGPGGCRSREVCEAFCQNPANQETCFQFGLEHGLIPPEKLAEMEQGKARMQEGLNQAPPEVLNCIVQRLGQETVDKIRAGTAFPSESMGNAMRTCWEQFKPPEPPRGPEEGMGPPPEGAGQPPAEGGAGAGGTAEGGAGTGEGAVAGGEGTGGTGGAGEGTITGGGTGEAGGGTGGGTGGAGGGETGAGGTGGTGGGGDTGGGTAPPAGGGGDAGGGGGGEAAAQ